MVSFPRTIPVSPRRQFDSASPTNGEGAKARNAVTKLPHGTSLLDLRSSLPVAADRQVVDGLQVFSQESALIECSANFFTHNSTDVRAVLLMVRDASGLLARLLAGGHTIIAGRLAGAFRNIGRDRIADDIVKTMTAAGYAVRENDPFTVCVRPSTRLTAVLRG